MLCDAARPVLGEHLACGVPYGYEKDFTHNMKAYMALSTFCDTSSKSAFCILKIDNKVR